MNPPYRKVGTASADRKALERIGLRITNLYPGFLGAAAELLKPGGQLSAITPRSFANGPYFLPFRRFFLSRMALSFVHVYERRGKVFADADVLQENIVFRAVRGGGDDHVTLSHSVGFHDEPKTRSVPTSEVINPDDPQLFVHIPVEEEAIRVAQQILGLPASLADLGVEVSTGRVVDFRARDHLLDDPDDEAAPLIYPSHLREGRVTWPQLDCRKPNALRISQATRVLLLPAGSYCLVKRFTSKEERRRVVAATFHSGDVPGRVVAFENHLNVFHGGRKGVDPALAAGLAAFLNTTAVDAYVRRFSGHTQINATDLRRLRYPDRGTLLALGTAMLAAPAMNQEHLDELVSTRVGGLGDERTAARAA
jgi:adenine-specific DNA-methyltransferase